MRLLRCPIVKAGGEHFEKELRAYILNRLRAPDMLPDSALEKRRQKIANGLLRRSGIDFRVIEAAFDGIKDVVASSGSEKELDEVLTGLDRSVEEISIEILEKLEAERSPKEITLVNHLLIWVGQAFQPFSISHLAAAVSLQNTEIPLRGLKHFLTTRANKLFNITLEGEVRLPDKMYNMITSYRDISQPLGPPMISLELKITNAPVPTVRRFFWDLAEFSALENFGFANYNTGSDSISLKEPIKLGMIEAHLHIAKTAAKFFKTRRLSNFSNEATEKYLVNWFPDHMRVLQEMGLDKIDTVDVMYISRCVLELLEDPRIIKMHWSIFQDVTSFLTRSTMGILWRWLNDDDDASEDFTAKQMEWVRSISLRRKYRLFFPTAKWWQECG
ncbi:hypothetical protein QBC38DRAFT_143617 [Podospora fimiseda]|uniref:Uncharacterized protein n=1 Tax=Podospora fimiseda TaxID=252190 RepID=A0AAN7BYK4_9PEZI|nr:hypothetical protein QBC38DRAFT_143617 [Podospora fimiseda]